MEAVALWEQVGTPVKTSTGVLLDGGLDWLTEKADLFDSDGKHSGYYACRRVGGKTFGAVSGQYAILQNQDVFDMFKPILEYELVSLDSCGSFNGGEIVWFLLKLPDSESVVDGDDVQSFLSVSHAHGGRMSIKLNINPVRITCLNSLSASRSGGVELRHIANSMLQLKDWKKMLIRLRETFTDTIGEYRALVRKPIGPANLRRFFEGVFEISQSIETKGNDKLMTELLHNFEYGIGMDISGVEGTVWAAYNAVTQHLTHSAGRTGPTRLRSLWFGEGNRINHRALNMALSMAT